MLQVSEGKMPDEAPRERAERHGVGVLSNAELWAIILRTGLTGLPITALTAEMMTANDNSLMRLEQRTREERLEMQGIGMVKAIQIEAVYEIAKRYFSEGPVVTAQIARSQDIYNYMRTQIANLPHEEIWVIFLKRNNQVISRMKITSGSAVASIFDLKKVMRHALLEKAEGLILCHNHPSGNLKPSPQDDMLTQKIKEAARLIDTRVHDHIIVTDGSYYSYNDEGRL